METKKNIIKSTESGRLYINTSDFFEQEEIKELLVKLKDSSIYKYILIQKAQKAKEKVEVLTDAV